MVTTLGIFCILFAFVSLRYNSLCSQLNRELNGLFPNELTRMRVNHTYLEVCNSRDLYFRASAVLAIIILFLELP